MRRLSLGQPSEDRIVGHLGTRLELLQPAHERAQLLQPPCPSVRVTAAVAVTPRPVGHALYRQLGRADRGVLLAYLQRLSGYSRAQVKRLVSSCGSGKLLVKNYRPLQAHPSIGKDCGRRETF